MRWVYRVLRKLPVQMMAAGSAQSPTRPRFSVKWYGAARERFGEQQAVPCVEAGRVCRNPVNEDWRAGVRVGVRAEQRVVVGVEVALVPDHRAVLGDVDHVHRPGPGLGVGPGPVEVRITPSRIGSVKVGQLE